MTKTGLDRLVELNFAPVQHQRIGLVTHPAALSSQRRSAVELFARHTNLVALFGPEHGLLGEAQDLIPVASSATAIPIHSLYGETFESLKPTPEMLRGLDLLVIDLVDAGSRYYTFQATMLFCLEASAAVGLPVMVLDRPNPIGDDFEGPTIQRGFESFVGVHPIAIRHGLTIGQLARLYKAERVPDVNLFVIDAVRGAADWILPPSPNMPTPKTALVYPGMCLIEGTNLSEGRGTTRPFEYVGFPGVDAQQLANRLNADGLPDVDFLPVTYRPTFQKHAGANCGGVFVHPIGSGFQPVRTGLAVLIAFRDLLAERFRWRTERYEFVDHIPAIDLLFGSDRERLLIESGARWHEIAQHWEPEEVEFRIRHKTFNSYPKT